MAEKSGQRAIEDDSSRALKRRRRRWREGETSDKADTAAT
jgi:hypothetical protein